VFARGTPTWIAVLPVSAALCAIGLYINYSLPLLVLTAFLIVLSSMALAFFRDPERTIGNGVVSPADGRVLAVNRGREYTEVRIFMNVHDVHVNRMPYDGTVTAIKHISGGYVPAYEKDADSNERVVMRIDTELGEMRVVQIAGALARRIIPYVREGQRLKKGERIGLIRFGSRVDLVVPSRRVRVTAQVGNRVKAGETSLGVVGDGEA